MGGGNTWISFTSTALANFAAQYNFQSIAISLLVMSLNECTTDDGDCRTGDQLAWVDGTSQATIFIGAVVGQLGMGFLGDFLTRNQALTVTLAVASLSAFLSAIAPAGNATSVYTTIIVFRFFLGIGLGGIYPLSATKAAEDSASGSGATNSAGSAIAFFWQIPGAVAPWFLSYLLTYTSLTTGYRWRLVLGLGAIPPFLSICCLWAESLLTQRRYSDAGEKMPVATPNPVTLAIIQEKLRDPKIRGKLIGCGGSWLLFDIVFYGLSLLGGVVISAISNGDDDVTTDANVRNLCSKQSIALALGAVSIVISIYLLPYLSLKYLQLLGFFVQAFFLALLVGLFTYLKSHDSNGLFALYCLALMSLQLGVPVTTYGLPASVFEKDIRCTFNGIASAMGKLGAIIGAYTFYYIAQASLHAVLIICVVVSLLGAYITHFYIDDASFASDEAAVPKRTGQGLSRTLFGGANKGSMGREQYVMFSPLSDSSVHTVIKTSDGTDAESGETDEQL
jgi:PHS family inorganic phosphate transporter-like MFS transporter